MSTCNFLRVNLHKTTATRATRCLMGRSVSRALVTRATRLYRSVAVWQREM